MNVLITGANGYLGGWVITKLEMCNHSLCTMDSHGSIFYKTKGGNWGKEQIINCRLSDVIIPLAWYSSVGNKYPSLQVESCERTLCLLDDIKESKSKARLVFASSASVYGNGGNVRLTEESEPHPNCDYSSAKLKVEQHIRDEYQNPYVIFRFGSLMGLGAERFRTKTELIVNAFAVDGWNRKMIRVWNPTDYKPVLHVKDAAELILGAVNGMFLSGTYNACEGSYRATDIAKTAAKITGAKLEIVGRSNASEKSCLLDCYKLQEQYASHKYFLRYHDVIDEFEKYEESPTDKNTPWVKMK